MSIRIPISTYRLQFNPLFRFKDAAKVIDYLSRLGITDCYTSPLMQATPGSMHSYDVTNPTRFNPDIGTEDEFGAFSQGLMQKNMGMIIDIIPNHMCISAPYNQWWNNVLENGPSSPFADFFNIEWNPLRQEVRNKVLLPFLDDQFGKVVESKELQVVLQEGAFYVKYFASIYPTSPSTWEQLLSPAIKELSKDCTDGDPDLNELESIITAIRYLPDHTATHHKEIAERQREKEIIKHRLGKLVKKSAKVANVLDSTLNKLNGVKEAPHTFDHLEQFINQQPYRLCHWRVASDELNYRRFFDINELAGIQAQNPVLFKLFHSVHMELVRKGFATGFRIDHVDGLYHPYKYLQDLQRECSHALNQNETSKNSTSMFVIIEKILGENERIRSHWPVHGTTGYDFLNQLNGIYVQEESKEIFNSKYSEFTDSHHSPSSLLLECKKFILDVSMSSELHVLAHQLDRISEQHRWHRDFTYQSLIAALRSVMASFTVYRTYICAEDKRIDREDEEVIQQAVELAKQINPAMNVTIFDFIESVLLLKEPPGLTEEQKTLRNSFVMRFQQLTGPVMAKGLEDTAFYRYYPLSSINEVGAELGSFGVDIQDFHVFNQATVVERPHTLLATSTHDTKRSEDVRARLNVLSEIPQLWFEKVNHWSALNQNCKSGLGPDSNEEYLIYQTLVGAWPLRMSHLDERKEFELRIIAYINKALKEAKIHTSWMNPNEEYDRDVRSFIHTILDPRKDNIFLKDMEEFVEFITPAGLFTSLSQTLLKLTCPGIPDIYQGCEVWNFSLVDPDNRREVNYEYLNSLLINIESFKERKELIVKSLMENLYSGGLKMYLIKEVLTLRKQFSSLFLKGDYIPHQSTGTKKNHVLAFTRALNGDTAIIISGRFFTSLLDTHHLKMNWEDTKIIGITPGKYEDLLTGKEFKINNEVPLDHILKNLPVSVLVPKK